MLNYSSFIQFLKSSVSQIRRRTVIFSAVDVPAPQGSFFFLERNKGGAQAGKRKRRPVGGRGRRRSERAATEKNNREGR